MGVGSKPIDDGNLIFERASDLQAFLRLEPAAEPFIRPYIGADEFVEGRTRWILALHEASATQLREMPRVMERLRLVREFRQKSSDAGTRALAATPTRYHLNVLPTHPFLLIPLHTSEIREYVPMGIVNPPAIPSNATIAVYDAQSYQFGVLTSRMHMAWLWGIGGRLESRVRYSKGIVYNNFPWPTADPAARARVEALADALLAARATHPGDSLEALYDPLTMPPDLRRAHQALDTAVDRLYRPAPFRDDVERVEHLLALYESLARPLTALADAPAPRRRRRV